MNNTIKIEVLIENDNPFNGYYSSFRVKEQLFTQFNYTMSLSAILEKVKKAMKASKGFTMITIDVLAYDCDQWRSERDVIAGYRYCCNREKEVTKACFNKVAGHVAGHYKDWYISNEKNVYVTIAEQVEGINSKFIEMVKATCSNQLLLTQ